MFEDIITKSEVEQIVEQIRSFCEAEVQTGRAVHMSEEYQTRIIQALLDKGIEVIPVKDPVIILNNTSLQLQAYTISSDTNLIDFFGATKLIFIRKWQMSYAGFEYIEFARI